MRTAAVRFKRGLLFGHQVPPKRPPKPPKPPVFCRHGEPPLQLSSFDETWWRLPPVDATGLLLEL
jgi:hypothetical protein